MFKTTHVPQNSYIFFVLRDIFHQSGSCITEIDFEKNKLDCWKQYVQSFMNKENQLDKRFKKTSRS